MVLHGLDARGDVDALGRGGPECPFFPADDGAQPRGQLDAFAPGLALIEPQDDAPNDLTDRERVPERRLGVGCVGKLRVGVRVGRDRGVRVGSVGRVGLGGPAAGCAIATGALFLAAEGAERVGRLRARHRPLETVREADLHAALVHLDDDAQQLRAHAQSLVLEALDERDAAGGAVLLLGGTAHRRARAARAPTGGLRARPGGRVMGCGV